MPISQSEADMEDPEQFAAWAFAAGVPDGRGEKFPHQPMIPAVNFKALSRMLWDMGFRHHSELQTKWVNARPATSPSMNFEAWGTTDVKPEQISELVEKEPEVAAKVADIGERLANAKSEEERQAIQAEVKNQVMRQLEQIRKLAGGGS